MDAVSPNVNYYDPSYDDNRMREIQWDLENTDQTILQRPWDFPREHAHRNQLQQELRDLQTRKLLNLKGQETVKGMQMENQAAEQKLALAKKNERKNDLAYWAGRTWQGVGLGQAPESAGTFIGSDGKNIDYVPQFTAPWKPKTYDVPDVTQAKTSSDVSGMESKVLGVPTYTDAQADEKTNYLKLLNSVKSRLQGQEDTQTKRAQEQNDTEAGYRHKERLAEITGQYGVDEKQKRYTMDDAIRDIAKFSATPSYAKDGMGNQTPQYPDDQQVEKYTQRVLGLVDKYGNSQQPGAATTPAATPSNPAPRGNVNSKNYKPTAQDTKALQALRNLPPEQRKARLQATWNLVKQNGANPDWLLSQIGG